MKNSIYLGVNGKFHAFNLAKEYQSLDQLGRLYAAHRKLAPPGGVPKDKFRNLFWLAYWQYAGNRFRSLVPYSDFSRSEVFDKWLRAALAMEEGGTFHGWNGNVLHTLRSLDPRKWRRCVERSCPHNQFQWDLLTQEAESLDLPFRANHQKKEKGIRELEECDIIIAPSTYSASSYEGSGLEGKVRVNLLGGNFKAMPREEKNGPLKVLLVGNDFLRKGTHYLIEAFTQVRDREAELWIRGHVPAEYLPRIRDPRIKVIPPVELDELHALYRKATMFVLPSIDEGFGMVGLEALAFGLPVIYTDHCGVGDLLSDKLGCRVPIRSSAALGEAIDEISRKSADWYKDFDCERARVLQDATWAATAARMVNDVYNGG